MKISPVRSGATASGTFALPRDRADIDQNRRRVFSTSDRHDGLAESIRQAEFESPPTNVGILVFQEKRELADDAVLRKDLRLQKRPDADRRFVQGAGSSAACLF